VTRADAEAECKRLAVESPDRHTHRWVPVEEAEDDWRVAKIGLAPTDEETGTEIRADEKPPTPDDPRTSGVRDIRPWGV
jgi:hypothetical protein